MSKSDATRLICKVVLLGESGVGKTSIITQFVKNEFSDYLTSSIGAEFLTKTVEFDSHNKIIDFEIWDTAGQERFRAMSKIFYADAEIALLVYDITKEDSFQEIKKYWMNEIKENASNNIIIGIVANKCDLMEEEKVNENDARSFANNFQAAFFPASAKDKDGINELFYEIGKIYLEKLGVNGVTKRGNKNKKKLSKDQNKETKNNKCC